MVTRSHSHIGWSLGGTVGLEMIVSAAIGIWIALLLMVGALCRAAKRGDEDMDIVLASRVVERDDADITQSPSDERALRDLDLDEAAALLGVAPERLLAWEARYGFPTSSGRERRYGHCEVLALRDSLRDGLSIASAVIRAREKVRRRRAADATRLFDHHDGGLAS